MMPSQLRVPGTAPQLFVAFSMGISLNPHQRHVNHGFMFLGKCVSRAACNPADVPAHQQADTLSRVWSMIMGIQEWPELVPLIDPRAAEVMLARARCVLVFLFPYVCE